MRNITLFSLSALLFLGGCSLSPDMNVPQIDVPKNTAQEVLEVDQTWWKRFNDPALNALVDEALANSDDLKLQALKVLKARQTYAYNVDNQFPNLTANASNSRNKTSDETYLHNRATYTDNNMGATLSYEVDLWGKLSSQSEASWSAYLATAAARETVRNTLIHDVVTAYFNLASLQQRIAILEQSADAYKATYEFRSKQQQAGTISDVLATQSLAQYQNAQAAKYALIQSYRLQQSALSVLLGQSPQQLFEHDAYETHLPMALVIPQGIPSSLMENRPDIKEALETLKSKNALIGVEKAAYFPTISLTGSYGQQSSDLDNILKSSANRWNLGPSLSVPIFDFGRISQRVSISKTDLQSALVTYEQTVKKAYKDVYDALAKQKALQQQLSSQEEEYNAYQKVLALTQKRFDIGVANQLEVIDARKNTLASSLNLISTKQALLVAQAELFKALGGGWNTQQLLTSKE